MSTAVYRHFNAAGRLLYIGMTDEPLRRNEQHAFDKPWWPEVATTKLEWHPTREAAAEAEIAAIKTEDPLYNRLHSPSYRRPVDSGLSLTEFRKNGRETVNHVYYSGDVVYITASGKRAAALVPIEVAERYEAEQLRAEVQARADRDVASAREAQQRAARD
jgi:PHD/YefM family antitoxin component YafN of YafNO toxin-antitoxin module